MSAEPTVKTQTGTSKTTGGETPLARLALFFKEDMKEVNGLIIEHLDADVPLIPELAQYLIMAGGKRIRPLLTLASTRLCGDNGPRPRALAAAVEFIHTATLLHDDVVDDSEERRGQDAAPVIFGNQATVLVGDFLFSRAFQLMVSDGNLEVLRILSDASAVIAQGEVMQLQTARNIETTIDEYKNVIAAKTAALFAAACEIGPVIAGSAPDIQKAMRDYGHNLGMAFQIADDVLDYKAQEKDLGKKVGDDFREGKITAPVIFALQNAGDDEKKFWQRALGNLDQTEKDLEKALEIISRNDSLSQTQNLAMHFVKQAKRSLSDIKAGPLKDTLLSLGDYTITRHY